MLTSLSRRGAPQAPSLSRQQQQRPRRLTTAALFQRARRRPPSQRFVAAGGGGGSGSGNGGGGGSGGGGGGGGGRDDGREDNNNNSNNSTRIALIAGVFAATATATAVVAQSSLGGGGGGGGSNQPAPPPAAAAAAAAASSSSSLPSLSLATSDDVAALKRLLRESFEAQLHARRRLDGLEQRAAALARAAADPLEGGDEVVPGARGQLSFSSQGARERCSPGVRVTGGAGYRGVLVWSNSRGKGGGGPADATAAATTTTTTTRTRTTAEAAAATLRALGAAADAGVSLHVHHHSPAAGRGRGIATGEADDEAAVVVAATGAEGPDATALVAAAAGGAAPSPEDEAATGKQRRRHKNQQPWHSRDRRITLRLSSSPLACDDDAGAVGCPSFSQAQQAKQSGGNNGGNADDAGDAGDAGGAAGALSARQLLVRLRPFDWLHLMVAPLGGSLAALARPPAPLVAVSSAARGPSAAATRALRQGHDLSALRLGGVGKAVAVSSGAVSLAVGHFAAPCRLSDGGGEDSAAEGGVSDKEAWRGSAGGLRATTAAQLALHPRDGESAVAVSLARVVEGGGADDGSAGGGGGGGGGGQAARPPPRFLGAAAPGFSTGPLSRAMLMPWLLPAAASSQQALRSSTSYVLGASWSAPVGDALAATAWAERRVGSGGGGGSGDGNGGGIGENGGGEDGGGGAGGWGVSLRTRAEGGGGAAGGPELAVVLARASTAVAGGGGGGGGGGGAANGKGGGNAAGGGQKGPIFCEVSARLSGGDGVSVTPGAIVTLGGEAPLVAYTIAGSWRF